ncbi:hypothetical protein KQX54_013670 [Cotesia glomerata]|uniref:Uncharacterized protein n=1 Tax=Cotesia glomerata TaxID=32391 RepID=A0AAV7HZ02_COTGL|nr:hypothetical protein KQX54_013670 [Cotesia glomerata]
MRICKLNYIQYNLSVQPICETDLLLNNKILSYDIKISKTSEPFWKPIEGEKGWLYSLPKPQVKNQIKNESGVMKHIRVDGCGTLTSKYTIQIDESVSALTAKRSLRRLRRSPEYNKLLDPSELELNPFYFPPRTNFKVPKGFNACSTEKDKKEIQYQRVLRKIIAENWDILIGMGILKLFGEISQEFTHPYIQELLDRDFLYVPDLQLFYPPYSISASYEVRHVSIITNYSAPILLAPHPMPVLYKPYQIPLRFEPYSIPTNFNRIQSSIPSGRPIRTRRILRNQMINQHYQNQESTRKARSIRSINHCSRRIPKANKQRK